jgi:hypothetical protein
MRPQDNVAVHGFRIFCQLPSFKREIVKDFCFDGNLEGYSRGEGYFTLKIISAFHIPCILLYSLK